MSIVGVWRELSQSVQVHGPQFIPATFAFPGPPRGDPTPSGVLSHPIWVIQPLGSGCLGITKGLVPGARSMEAQPTVEPGSAPPGWAGLAPPSGRLARKGEIPVIVS